MQDIKKFADMLKDKYQNGLIANKMQLTDMNTDCMILIFNEMDFDSFINIAQTNKALRDLAVDGFRRKFANKTIIFEDYEVNPSKHTGLFSGAWEKPNHKISNSIIDEDQIKVRDYTTIMNTLHIFGSLIQRIKLVYNYAESSKSKAITSSLNNYCADSLIELQLDNSLDIDFDFMSKPFQKLNHIIFGGTLNAILPQENYPTLAIDKVFPQVRQLTLNRLMFGPSYPIFVLPNLQHVNVHVANGYDHFAMVLIERNPKIQSINFNEPTINLLNATSQFLLNLENLTVSSYPFGFNTFHFESVTKFDVDNVYPENFAFSHLQELTMKCYHQKCNHWIDFFQHHNNLTRLHIDDSNINDNQFKLITDLMNLVEMSVTYLQGEPLQVGTIIRFMENHNNLMKFSLGTCRSTDKEILQTNFENQWNITNYHNCLAFERTNTV